jgi:excisionase family DNA binding protein
VLLICKSPREADFVEPLKVTAMGANEMLTTQEAAAFLGLTVGYLYKLTMQKKIPYYKPFGNRCYFKRDELAQILQSNRIATVEETQRQAVVHVLSK